MTSVPVALIAATHLIAWCTDVNIIPKTLSDLHADILSALEADLETGSHHFNNAAHAEFARKYPRLTAAIAQLGEEARILEDAELHKPADEISREG